MINIFGLNITAYGLFFLLSFILSFVFIFMLLLKSGIPNNIIGYSFLINIFLILYCAKMYGVIVSGFEESIFTSGFASLGGAIGLVAGVWIMTLIYPEGRDSIWRVYITVLPLFYGISKIGCALAGCCHGIPYEGIGAISYNNDHIKTGMVFPVQACESALFIMIFVVSMIMYWRKQKDFFYLVLVLCATVKGSMDFLRAEHVGKIVSTNQWICLIFFFAGLFLYIKHNKLIKSI